MTAPTSGPGAAPVDTVGAASGSEPTTPGPEPSNFTGRDDELEYLVERYDDGELRVKTRPVGGPRWSRPVVLRRAS